MLRDGRGETREEALQDLVVVKAPAKESDPPDVAEGGTSVMICYAHTDGAHVERVTEVATKLAGLGFDIRFDGGSEKTSLRWPCPSNWSSWRTESICTAHKIILVCDDEFVRCYQDTDRLWAGERRKNLAAEITLCRERIFKHGPGDFLLVRFDNGRPELPMLVGHNFFELPQDTALLVQALLTRRPPLPSPPSPPDPPSPSTGARGRITALSAAAVLAGIGIWWGFREHVPATAIDGLVEAQIPCAIRFTREEIQRACGSELVGSRFLVDSRGVDEPRDVGVTSTETVLTGLPLERFALKLNCSRAQVLYASERANWCAGGSARITLSRRG